MRQIRCLAIDDEPLALQQLVGYIAQVPFLSLVAQCRSAVEAKSVIDREAVDAVFCDINMPDLNGLDFIRRLSAPPLVVFTTAYSDYAVEGYKVDAVDYLLKPFGLDEFRAAANRLQHRLSTTVGIPEEPQEPTASAPAATGSLFVRSDGRNLRINISDIEYVEGMSEYLKLHLSGQKPVIVLYSMKKMDERLPQSFMRIHRSYIVNLDKIVEVNKNRVVMASGANLPVGDLYRERLNAYIGGNSLL